MKVWLNALPVFAKSLLILIHGSEFGIRNAPREIFTFTSPRRAEWPRISAMHGVGSEWWVAVGPVVVFLENHRQRFSVNLINILAP